MGTRVGVVALPLLWLGCTSPPTVEGTAAVTVIDALGHPSTNDVVWSSAGSTALASAPTDATGTAKIGVARGGEVTRYGLQNEISTSPTGNGLVSYTVFGVEPDITVQLPVLEYIGSPQSTRVEVTTGGADFGGATDSRAYTSFSPGCNAAAALEQFSDIPDSPPCRQTDGATTLTALLRDSTGAVAGYAISADTAIGSQSTMTLAPIAGAATTTVAADILNIPSIAGATMDTALYFRHKGQGFGIYAGDGGVPVTGSVHLAAPLVGAALADSDYASVTVRTDHALAFAERALDGAGNVTLDAAAIPAVPTAASVAFDGDQPVVTITDPGPAGSSTFVALTWTGPDRVPHTWFGWAAAPTEAGTRTFAMPALPADKSLDMYAAPKNVPMTVYAGYEQADFAPSDYRLGPEPFVPIWLPHGERSYSQLRAP